MRKSLCVLGFAFIATRAGGASADFGYAYRPEWRRFGSWDYAGTAAVLGTYLGVELSLDGPRGAEWSGGTPFFDRPLHKYFAAETREQREHADWLSDIFWHGTVAYSVLDAALVPLIRRGNLDATWQLSLMNIQAYSVTSLLIRIPHKLVGRRRPLDDGCREDPSYSDQCGTPARFVSFPGGHTAVSMTGAGLACAHHIYGELYGGGLPDALACTAALGSGTLVGYYRLRADKHWLSDQLFGIGVGLGSGFLLPTLLYYRPFWRERTPHPQGERKTSRFTPVLLPMISEHALGVQLFAID